ncbi:MAG: PA14 domain-containing protein, partial [Planctomycetota bacterium]
MADNFDDVNDRTAAAFQGSQTSASIAVGIVGFPFPDGLAAGTTYYWAIDEVEADGTTKHKGPVWSFSIVSRSAYNPNPSDGRQYVDADVTLSWAAGLDAKLHYVYFGDSFEDVDNATGGAPLADTTFTPGTLELGKTYYWRVDESNPPNPVVRGDVWSFTTTLAGLGTAVMERWENITGTDLNTLKSDPRFPDNPDVNETVNEFLWNGADIDEYGARIEAWLYVPATGDYTFWLATDDNGELWLSTDDDSSGIELIARIPGWSDVNQWTKFASQKSDPVPLVAGQRYYIVALWKEGGGGDHCNVAWEGPGIPTRTTIPGGNLSPFEPMNAFGAQPANGAVGVTQTPTLQWKAGLAAASHEVYFGTDPNAVANATKASPEYIGTRALGDEIYEPAMLAWSTTYYWRVDEINNGNPDSPWVGKVRSFTTADFGIVEDFEIYNDIESGQPGSKLVYETWLDGYDDPTNGSAMGYTEAFQPTMETTTVHGGDQSAPMGYDNTGAALSEVTRTLVPQNWTDNGIQTLSLWFYGDPANTPGQLYVKINGVQV